MRGQDHLFFIISSKIDILTLKKLKYCYVLINSSSTLFIFKTIYKENISKKYGISEFSKLIRRSQIYI